MKEALRTRAFTLVETLMAVVVLTVLAAIAVSVYTGYRDRVAIMVDETNQKILQAAVKIAAASTGSVAGSLSELAPEDVGKAYAGVMRGRRPYTLLAYVAEFWKEAYGGDVAHADTFLPPQYYNKNLKVITCPSDQTPPKGFDAKGRPFGGVSYAINKKFRGKPYSFLGSPENADEALVYEVEEGPGEKEEFRHQKGHLSVRISVSGKPVRKDKNASEPRGRKPDED